METSEEVNPAIAARPYEFSLERVEELKDHCPFTQLSIIIAAPLNQQ